MSTIININHPFVYVKSNNSGANRGENWERKQSIKAPIIITKKCPFTNQFVSFYVNSRKEENELNSVLSELKFEAKIKEFTNYAMVA